MAQPIADYLGFRGPRFTVKKHLGRIKKATNHYWLAECDCGNEFEISSGNIKAQTECRKCSSREKQKAQKYSRNQGGDLYMIAAGPYIKIGTTENIEVRLRTIQSTCPLEIKLVGLWKGMAHLEKSWHEALAHAHERGEWFKIGT